MINPTLTSKQKYECVNQTPVVSPTLSCTDQSTCPPSDDRRQKAQQRQASIFCGAVKPPVGGTVRENVLKGSFFLFSPLLLTDCKLFQNDPSLRSPLPFSVTFTAACR